MTPQVDSNKAYQVLIHGRSAQGEVQWHLPSANVPGEWVDVFEDDLIANPAAHWRDGAQLFAVEYVENDGKLQARLTEEIQPDDYKSLGIFTTGKHNVHSGVYAACGDAHIVLTGAATLYISGRAQVQGEGTGKIHASGAAQVKAYGRIQLTACENARVFAYGNCHVAAKAHAQVFLFDQATADGDDGVSIRGYKNANITARGKCKVWTFDTTHARLFDKVVAYADGTSIIRATADVDVIRRSVGAQVLPFVSL
ncbi:MAG TPA: hypothetical protein V6C81_12380 [Planktothrix sp.]|jgi:hypothetical protein